MVLLKVMAASLDAESEPPVRGCDDAALLQFGSHPALATGQFSTETKGEINGETSGGITGTSERATCELADLDSGRCLGEGACSFCNLQGQNSTLPTNGFSFPDFKFLCEGFSACSLTQGSEGITFQDGGQVMVCKGAEACSFTWEVSNVGAICCSSVVERGMTCDSTIFQLGDTDACQNDVCCDGNKVCTNSTMNNVESLLCQGNLACSQSMFQIERDLYCNETSEGNPDNASSTCTQSTFTFSSDNTHAIDCLGNDVCSRSTFTLDSGSSSYMQCDSEAEGTLPGAGGACTGSVITIQNGACLDLNCTQPEDCVGLTVSEIGTGFCNWIGDENDPRRPEDCSASNETACGEVPRDPICCRDDPDCGSCCERTTTTSTPPFDPNTTTSTTTTEGNTTTTTSAVTTTTKTKTKKPYPYHRRIRRNRRQDRRQNRRQNRRNRRQYR
eukprot:CAMPEP_0114661210 /NCGR_PEP_ID=MMETSP0191-20121206/21945_1 /TAXON_ID=126664 /ORGANISM="Sorites sp." /LENGTH=444 /DNA_ID=CAMNT_0001892855 /DNA_START=92 /DNA_END=1426 /DNA_ORIENTATION=+